MGSYQPRAGHKSQVHSGKVEDQQKLEHNRINVGTPPIPATKTGSGAADAGKGGKAPLPPKGNAAYERRHGS